ncbi:Protein of unknown function [Bacillus cytotoxicus]|uniref:Uncharacterized protein n=1 Tax=Bacillus cytotoxicus TaxID=580165 RepID=A0AAX2CJ51_9BACI|nr:Protein of unknown function [Bacillus cytotoxicus]SCN39979.1 Protein of unknown function [Bacillus cytotoxicus]
MNGEELRSFKGIAT